MNKIIYLASTVVIAQAAPTVCTIQKNPLQGDFSILDQQYESKAKVSKSHWGLKFSETDCKFTSCQIVFEQQDADDWFSMSNSNFDESIDYIAVNDKANHAKFVSGVQTKCTDELGGQLTSDPYSVTFAHCESDDALTKKAGFQFDSTPEPWRTPREWQTISKSSSLQTVDMFTHNQYCPITSCFLLSGWKAATPAVAAQDAVEASEGVEAKDAVAAQPATEAHTCYDTFQPDYKLVAGDDTIDGSKTYNLQTKPSWDGLNSNLCIQCNGIRGAVATQKFTFVQTPEPEEDEIIIEDSTEEEEKDTEQDSSDDEDDIVDPAAEGDNTALIVVIVVVVALLLCVSAGCYYGAGKPKTKFIEITAVNGNLGGKAIDVEAAGGVKAGAGVKAKGQFSAVPLDSARTNASGHAV